MNLRKSIALALMGVVVAGCTNSATGWRDSEQEGYRLYNEHKYEDAVTAFHNAVGENPRAYHAQYYLGASLDALGKYPEALQAYESSLDEMQHSVEAKIDSPFRDTIIDAIAMDVSRVPHREKEIQRLTKKPKESGDAQDYIVLARVYRAVGDPNSAIAAYKQALSADPNNFYIHREFGLYLYQINLPEEAADELARARELNNQDDGVNETLKKLGR